jgi:hypothetical protein
MCDDMHLFFPKGRVMAQCTEKPDEHQIDRENLARFLARQAGLNMCEDCRFYEVSGDEEPCCHCMDSEFFEPKEDTIKKNNHDPDFFQQKLREQRDQINHPEHYTAFPVEVKDMIRDILTRAYGQDGYRAYCLGNEIKYRMRAGWKGEAVEDIGKAMKYKEFREGLK